MGKVTTVSPWYKFFKKGEKGVYEFRDALIRRQQTLSGMDKFIFSGDTIMNQIVDVVSSLENQKNNLSDNMRELKKLMEEERKAWNYMGQALLKHNHTIVICKGQLENAEVLKKLDKNKITNLKAQLNGAIASIKQAFSEYKTLLSKILKAEAMFLPFNKNGILARPQLEQYFVRIKTLKAIDALEAA